MLPVSQLRKGVIFEEEGQLWRVLEYEHNKAGRGNATIRTKLRNMRSGATLTRTFQSGGNVQDVRLDHKQVQYLYNDAMYYYFMDVETFEQPALSSEMLKDIIPYLKEGTILDLETYEGEPIDIEIPITVDLKVIEAPIGYAGDTATNAQKEVTLETGLKLQVPLFVNAGDILRIDTRTGAYQTRV
jgi:elongation factor P